jgi:HK97 family phage prohead protease
MDQDRSGQGSLVIEGYASLFGVEDLVGDVVRAGAFTRSLMRERNVGMLLNHRGGRMAGRWTTIREDGRGLFVRGLVEDETAAGVMALSQIREGRLNGLSIGFIARDWAPRTARGRELREIDLREISLVAAPMLQSARFAAVGGARVLERRVAA